MQIVSSQSECNAAFRHWANTLIENTKLTEYGWIIEGKGVLFTNYGHGSPGEITREVMLGFDPDTGSSTVKIVQPNAAKRDKGPVTVLATDDTGNKYLLREGRLVANKVSTFIKDKFADLSGLTEVPLMVDGRRSTRHWYIVANLNAGASEIVAQAADFSNACAQARALASGGKSVSDAENEDNKRLTYGMDEKGRITTRVRPGGSLEITELQGYVYQELKKIVGKDLKKPKRNGYCVDGMIEPANLLIEIKTGTAAHCIYEAVGQLQLYPSLVGIHGKPEPALLIPDKLPLKPAMVAALANAKISVFTYGIGDSGKEPSITFPAALIERCRRST
ncbi:hypothetical protein IBL26_23400 [Roseomonas aerophila]|uniref:Uncharacterized protein n=1 Tax=Teichococcus aerophilus TaxID=1224513 RepID=A0ABR7RTW5_9PROT|nr:hypothetical protein [Pseudoroseomonas aerophila]MBC9209803.1 hypothetical protein [Pseudoroseomonas aerophila]